MPSLLVDIGANVARLQRDVSKAQNSMNGFAKTARNAFRTLAGLYVASGLKNALVDTAKAYMVQENAINKLAVAMKNQGDYSKAAITDLQNFASQMQKITTVGDEVTISMLGNLKTYGLMGDELKQAAKTALDFAAAKKTEGLTVKTASELIGKAYVGETGALSRYGIIIDKSLKGTQKFDAVMKQLQHRFGGAAQAELNTYAGQWEQIANIWGDIKEGIGAMVLSITNDLIPALKTAASWAQRLTEYFSQENKLLRRQTELQEYIAKLQNQSAVTKTSDWLNKIFGHDPAGERAEQIRKANEELKKVTQQLAELQNVEGKTNVARNKNYESFVKEQAGMEQWLADEKKHIVERSGDELLGLYEELYRATGWESYAEKAIGVYQKVLDAQEMTWASILGNEDEAHMLRLEREREYVNDIYKSLDDIVDAEYDAAQERVNITRDMVDTKLELEEQGARATDNIQSRTVTNVRYYTTNAYGGRQFISKAEYDRLQLEELKKITESTFELTSFASRAEDRDLERLQAEQQREIQMFWDQQARFTESLLATSTTLEDFIVGLQTGGNAPYQAMGIFGMQYENLFQGAFGDQERLQSFLSFLPDYLTAERGFGGNYVALFSNVLSDLETLQLHYEAMGWLSNLGIGETASEINMLIEAFNALGISTDELREAAAAAAGTGGVQGLGIGLTATETPFQNIIDALGTMTGTTEEKLIAIGNMWQAMVTGIGGSMASISGTIQGIYQQAQQNPTVTYQPTTVDLPWLLERSFDGMQARYVAKYGYSVISATNWMSPLALQKPTTPYPYTIWGPPGQGGGLWQGNRGGEWFVPTYEPERGRFLRDVGADPDAIGAAVARNMRGLVGGDSQTIQLVIDGRVLAEIQTDNLDRYPAMVERLREIM